MKTLVLDSESKTCTVQDVTPKLSEYYRLIHCDLIDIVDRHVGSGRHRLPVSVICDDEGLLTEDPKISAIDNAGGPMFCGSMILCHTDENGELYGLSESEAAFLRGLVDIFPTKQHPEGLLILTQCEY